MENFWTLILALALLAIFGILFYRIMKGYVKETFGKKWLKNWGNKAYFFQSLAFMTMACTLGVLYLLKYIQVITF